VIDKLNLILQHQRKTDETINQMKQMLENYETKIKYLTDENDNLKSANQNLHKSLILTEDAINRMNL
jgi:regulator of replication initiation timing